MVSTPTQLTSSNLSFLIRDYPPPFITKQISWVKFCSHAIRSLQPSLFLHTMQASPNSAVFFWFLQTLYTLWQSVDMSDRCRSFLPFLTNFFGNTAKRFMSTQFYKIYFLTKILLKYAIKA